MKDSIALPLEGITVLDLTRNVAGPSAGMYLGDFGADVIKVEPLVGDASRGIGSERIGDHDEFSPLFMAFNRNKRDIAVDLKSDRGSEIVLKLAGRSDVVLQNFLPGVAAKLGVGFEQVREIRPDVIYCNISGWGQQGPLRSRGAYDTLLQAYAGPMSVTGYPGGQPVRFGPPAIDLLTGAHAAIGILLALVERNASGRGQEIDVSLYDTTLHMMSQFIAQWTGFGVNGKKSGSKLEGAVPYGVFKGSDREFYIGVATDEHWRRLCERADLPELGADARFVTNRGRVQNQELLYSELEPIFASRPASVWVEICELTGIPCGLVNDISEVVEQQQAAANEMIVDVEIGNVRTAGIPIKLSRTPGTYRLAPATVGRDTKPLLVEAGYLPGDIDEFLENRTVVVA